MKKFCLVWLLIFSLIYPVASQEVDSADLLLIDNAIKETRYNDALLMLNAFIKKFPQKFDSAQKRIKKIMLAREEYAALSKTLLDVILNEPENNEKKLQIIAELESLEKHPTSEALAFINQAKIAAQFTYYRAVFNRLMEEGSTLVGNEKYSEAVAKFKEGFVLYQEDFFYNTSDTELKSSVHNALEDIDFALPNFDSVQNSLILACEAFIAAVKSGNYRNAQSAFYSVQAEFFAFARIRNQIVSAGIELDKSLYKLQSSDEQFTDSSFLPFVTRFTFGRQSNPNTGVLGAMDALWNTLVEKMKDCIYLEMHKESSDFEKSVASMNGNSLARSAEKVNEAEIFTSFFPNVEILTSIQSFSALALEVNSLYSLRIIRDGSYNENFCPQFDSSMKYIAEVSKSILAQVDSINSYRQESDIIAFNNLPESFSESLRQEQTDSIEIRQEKIPFFEKLSRDSKERIRNPLFLSDGQLQLSMSEHNEKSGFVVDSTKSQATKGSNASESEQIASNYFNETSSSFDSLNVPGIWKVGDFNPGIFIPDKKLDWQIAKNILSYLCENTASLADAKAVKCWQDIATYFAYAGRDIADEYEANYSFAQQCLHLTDEQKSPDGSVWKIGSYPLQALNLVNKLDVEIVKDKKLLVDSQKLLLSAENYHLQIEDSEKLLASSIARLDSFGGISRDVALRANEAILLANRAENEGNLRYNQALQALRRNDFNGARESLQRARLKYNESLSYQASDELLLSSDEKLIALGEEITSLENKVVVVEVRSLKNAARNAYYAGNFEEAENLLTRAKARWAITNVESDIEITNLLSMVITALSMQTGRTILPTAPLYPEMSQILSIANQYYDQGKKLLSEGKKQEATVILQQAKDKLRELQLVYPLNQEASLLTLRIDKLIDPASFEAMFAARVKNAQMDYKKESTRQKAYTDLLDLYTINPNYPNLANLIYNVEIEIGIRQKPIDRSDLLRSDTLTSDAQKIVDSSRSEIELRQALSLVDQAIALNPQNQAAAVLKDRIQVSIGGKATVVLSAEDEMLYQQAIQELQSNNIIKAYSIVQQLLQSSTNKRSSKVIDLQKKVQALL